MRFARLGAALAATGGLWAAAALAHHSFSVAFDVERQVTVEGVVTGVKWENPHAWIYVETRRGDAGPEQWQFETLPPNQLRRKGITPALLKPGVGVTLRGYGAYDRSRTIAAANTIVFADGESFLIAAGRQPPLQDDP